MIHYTIHIEMDGSHTENIGHKGIKCKIDCLNGEEESEQESIMKIKDRLKKIKN